MFSSVKLSYHIEYLPTALIIVFISYKLYPVIGNASILGVNFVESSF